MGMTSFDVLQNVRESLRKPELGFDTVDIGVERNLSVKDYPFVRCVLDSERDEDGMSAIVVIVFFGLEIPRGGDEKERHIAHILKSYQIREAVSNAVPELMWSSTNLDAVEINNAKTTAVIFEGELRRGC